MIDKKFVKGAVVANKHWTETLYSLKIDADIQQFTPGQFGRLALEIDDQQIARPYSFVNGIDEPHHEFYSIVVPDGLLSKNLHALKPGDDIWLASKPVGFFTLAEVPQGKSLWMLSTGTAIGPFLSILKSSEVWERFEHIVLVHAVRFAKELSYAEDIALLTKRDAKFKMIPFVSREACPGAMAGRIPAAITSGALEEAAGVSLNASDAQVMLCGNPAMVTDTSEMLKAMDFTKNRRKEPGNITTENYW